jgi:hypothetical protein
VDEVKAAERDGAAMAGSDLVFYPAQFGPARQGGDVEPEFLVELAGQRCRDLFVSVDEAARQRVLVAAGPLTVDQCHLSVVEDEASADRQSGNRPGIAGLGAVHEFCSSRGAAQMAAAAL